MNLLKLDLLLFWELGKLYDKYGLKLRVVKQSNSYQRRFNLVCANNNEVILKNISKKELLGILQDTFNGLYARRYNELMEKITKIALVTAPIIN